ncbi:MAG: hypothetical protein JO336_19695 [Acidobacteriia bacterium]|nr:hypothetical protein [Terriglobia bacterium]MBV8904325.1 hypothetical protein [Terriglobia bacterium]
MRLTRRRFLSSTAVGALAMLAPGKADAVESVRDGASEELLDEIERRACLYFYEMADPTTGLILDRAVVDLRYAPGPSSIAATGFGLSALAIADTRHYLDRDVLRARTRRLLGFLNKGAEQEHGFFYHFLDSATGKRIWKSEVSSVDTCWLLCGVLHAKAYWDDEEIRSLATALLDRADWQWMLNGSNLTLSHGWVPERGFLPYRWDAYCELLAMYLLAMSSETHPIPAACWSGWKRPMTEFQGIFFIDANTPLFVHQYSHAWFDFRNRADRFANYYVNSQRATQAHRLFCMSLAPEYPWFGPNMWGVTASDSRKGYAVWVSPNNPPDGTLVPCAAGGSLGILPQLSGAVLQNMYETYGDHIWTKYGFRDAFHPQAGWYSPDVIGINLGITLIMAENFRTSSVWDVVMSTPEAARAVKAAGLQLIRS